jgi:hypothetical protein
MNRFPLFVTMISLSAVTTRAETVSVGEGEVKKCEERIAAVQRDVLNKYDDSLAELQATFQKAADLEGALATRNERQRVAQESALTEKNIVVEPRALHALQVQTLTKMQELIQQLINETVPKLIEYKKSLTVAGKLDEAVAVRTAIEQLQNNHLPASRAEPGEVVPADTLLSAYVADRNRADKIYKGQKLVVRGTVGGFRQDPANAKQYLVFLGGSTAGNWIQCAFAASDFQFREETQFNNSILILSSKGKDARTFRLQKGASVDIHGTCDGLDETVRLSKCEM